VSPKSVSQAARLRGRSVRGRRCGRRSPVGGRDITIHSSFLPHNDPEASLAFYRDTLGFEVRNDVGYEGMRWITVGPVGQPGTSIVLHPPVAGPGVTEDERRTIAEMMVKGTYAIILLAPRPRRRLRAAPGQRRRGGPGADRPALRHPRLRVPRPRGQPGAHQPTPLKGCEKIGMSVGLNIFWRRVSTRTRVTCRSRPWTRSGPRPTISCWVE
jgi:catechol 2,3-dioxygenase-like lactoylglutathione lyase family enzyme